MLDVRRFPGARLYLAAAVFAVLWGLLLRHLSAHWEANVQYSFGWLVPLIAVYLGWRRWTTRPAPEVPFKLSAAFLVMGAAALALLPTWLVEQPNPDWRLVSWALAAEIVALTLGAVYLVGGASWLSHFAFPVCFILSAIPWPTWFELLVVENLMRVVAGITVNLVNVFGVPAMQHGNVIEIGAGMLGIDDACSGLRSLQATVMAALFIGEVYRFAIGRRILLAGIGIALAFGCNVIRASALTLVAARSGLDAIARWHDPAGFSIVAICFAGLWIAALKLAPEVAPAAPRAGTSRPHLLPLGPMVTLAIWVVIVLGATEGWYRLHENQEKQSWFFAWPIDRAGYRELQIPELASEALGFDRGRAAEWGGEEGSHWTAFFFEWDAGPARSRILARSHRPEICLTAAGYKLLSDEGTVAVRTSSLDIPFRAFTFETNGRPVHVFFCIWEDSARARAGSPITSDWSRSFGVSSVLRGERNLGQRVLELAISGYPDLETAEVALVRHLPEWIEETTDRASTSAPLSSR